MIPLDPPWSKYTPLMFGPTGFQGLWCCVLHYCTTCSLFLFCPCRRRSAHGIQYNFVLQAKVLQRQHSWHSATPDKSIWSATNRAERSDPKTGKWYSCVVSWACKRSLARHHLSTSGNFRGESRMLLLRKLLELLLSTWRCLKLPGGQF